jgi:AcrR family transcriptional regulator
MCAVVSSRRPALPRPERERLILDTAHRLFYARGVHEVGMDELVRETGLGKATVYRLYPSKDALLGAYLRQLKADILSLIDAEIARHADDPGAAILAIFTAIERDVGRRSFRGCPFNNASIEFSDRGHPARVAAREYRQELQKRLRRLAKRARPGEPELGDQLALLIDGIYTSGAHLGPRGPAASAPKLVARLIEADG